MTTSKANRRTVVAGYSAGGTPIKLRQRQKTKRHIEALLRLDDEQDNVLSQSHVRQRSARRARTTPSNTVLRGGRMHTLPTPQPNVDRENESTTQGNPEHTLQAHDRGDVAEYHDATSNEAASDWLSVHEAHWRPPGQPDAPQAISRRAKHHNSWVKWKETILPKLFNTFMVLEKRLFVQEALPALPRIDDGLVGRCQTTGCRQTLSTTVVECIERTGQSHVAECSSMAHG
jgi:hypothetical protein